MKNIRKLMAIAIIGLFIGTAIVGSENIENRSELSQDYFELLNISSNKNSIVTKNIGSSLDYEVMFSQPFNMFGDFTIFFSDNDKGKTVYEDFWGIDDEICKVSWWGIPLHGSTSNPSFDGSAEDMSFDINFYDDHDSSISSKPDDIIESFIASANQVIIKSSIAFTINGVTYHFSEFAYELPIPIEVSDGDGWVSIESVDDDSGDYLGWLNSEDGDNFLYQNGGKSNDVALKLYKETWINHPPSTPSRPNGLTSGKTGEDYEYSTSSSDPDGDQIEYEWDFDGDRIADKWTGFYSSGETCFVNWSWLEEGNYNIRVKAIDEYGSESSWSESLQISIPKNRKDVSLLNQVYSFLNTEKSFMRKILDLIDIFNPSFSLSFKNYISGSHVQSNSQPPNVCFNWYPYQPEVGETITFDASCSQGDITSYSWAYSCGTHVPIPLGSGKILITSFDDVCSVGAYTIYLTVTGPGGSDSTNHEVTVKPPSNDLPVACYSCSDYTPVVGQIVTFDGSCSYDPDGYIDEYYWCYDDHGPMEPQVMGYGEMITYVWSEPLICEVILQVRDDEWGYDTKSKTVSVSASSNSPPEIPSKPSGPIIGTIGESLTFSTSTTDPDGDHIKYGWDWNGDNDVDEWSNYLSSGSTDTRSHSWNQEGSYQLKVRAKDINNGQSSWSEALTVTISEESADADLDCSGSLSWSNVEPGGLVTGSFFVRNIGDTGSHLNWKVDSYPSWGDWTFSPESGNSLVVGDSETVEVFVVAPDVDDSYFDGDVRIVNEDDSSDYETISISLSTPKNKVIINPLFQFFEKLLNNNQNLFPLLRNILDI